MCAHGAVLAASPAVNVGSRATGLTYDTLQKAHQHAVLSNAVRDTSRKEVLDGKWSLGKWDLVKTGAEMLGELGVPAVELERMQKSGFDAALYRSKDNGEYVLAFRGTEPWGEDDRVQESWLPPDLRADLAQAFGFSDPQYSVTAKIAIEAHRLAKKKAAPLSITGHSLGGGLAQVAGLVTGCETFTVNPAGLSNETFERACQIASRDRNQTSGQAGSNIHNFVVEGEVVSSVLEPTVTALKAAINPASLRRPGTLIDFRGPAPVGETHKIKAQVGPNGTEDGVVKRHLMPAVFRALKQQLLEELIPILDKALEGASAELSLQRQAVRRLRQEFEQMKKDVAAEKDMDRKETILDEYRKNALARLHYIEGYNKNIEDALSEVPEDAWDFTMDEIQNEASASVTDAAAVVDEFYSFWPESGPPELERLCGEIDTGHARVTKIWSVLEQEPAGQDWNYLRDEAIALTAELCEKSEELWQVVENNEGDLGLAKMERSLLSRAESQVGEICREAASGIRGFPETAQGRNQGATSFHRALRRAKGRTATALRKVQMGELRADQAEREVHRLLRGKLETMQDLLRAAAKFEAVGQQREATELVEAVSRIRKSALSYGQKASKHIPGEGGARVEGALEQIRSVAIPAKDRVSPVERTRLKPLLPQQPESKPVRVSSVPRKTVPPQLPKQAEPRLTRQGRITLELMREFWTQDVPQWQGQKNASPWGLLNRAKALVNVHAGGIPENPLYTEADAKAIKAEAKKILDFLEELPTPEPVDASVSLAILPTEAEAQPERVRWEDKLTEIGHSIDQPQVPSEELNLRREFSLVTPESIGRTLANLCSGRPEDIRKGYDLIETIVTDYADKDWQEELINAGGEQLRDALSILATNAGNSWKDKAAVSARGGRVFRMLYGEEAPPNDARLASPDVAVALGRGAEAGTGTGADQGSARPRRTRSDLVSDDLRLALERPKQLDARTAARIMQEFLRLAARRAEVRLQMASDQVMNGEPAIAASALEMLEAQCLADLESVKRALTHWEAALSANELAAIDALLSDVSAVRDDVAAVMGPGKLLDLLERRRTVICELTALRHEAPAATPAISELESEVAALGDSIAEAAGTVDNGAFQAIAPLLDRSRTLAGAPHRDTQAVEPARTSSVEAPNPVTANIWGDSFTAGDTQGLNDALHGKDNAYSQILACLPEDDRQLLKEFESGDKPVFFSEPAERRDGVPRTNALFVGGGPKSLVTIPVPRASFDDYVDALARRGRFDRAISYLEGELAVAKKKEKQELLSRMAALYRCKGDMARAQECLKRLFIAAGLDNSHAKKAAAKVLASLDEKEQGLGGIEIIRVEIVNLRRWEEQLPDGRRVFHTRWTERTWYRRTK